MATQVNKNQRTASSEQTYDTLVHASVLARRVVDHRLAESADIDTFEYLVLKNIADSHDVIDHKPAMKLKDLSCAIGVTLSHLSRVIDRCEKRNMITRVRDYDDRRSRFAVLTEHGEHTLKTAMVGYHRAIDDVFSSAMSTTELHTLNELLAKVVDHNK